jgi:hypothetical protein
LNGDTEPTVRVAELGARLSQHPAIHPHLDAVLWIGSASRGVDRHDHSDLDLQLLMDRPDVNATRGLAEVLAGRHDVDLSVVYRADVLLPTGELDFQDGTKGPFFIYVLATAELVYGTNPYPALLDRLTLDQVRPSVMFTIREYLARLRVMVVQSLERPYEFKKYSLKLFKDVLVASGSIPLAQMTATTNSDVVTRMRDYHRFPDGLTSALELVTDFAASYPVAVRVAMLMEYETIVSSLYR